MFYTAFTQFLGFPKYGDEYKMMGLGLRRAPLRRESPRCRQDPAASSASTSTISSTTPKGVEMTWDDGEPSLGTSTRQNGRKSSALRASLAPNSSSARDLAASVQAVLEENYFAFLNYLQKQTGPERSASPVASL
jgi:carbamoyltransferase